MATAVGKLILAAALKAVGKKLGVAVLNSITGDAFNSSKKMLDKIQQGTEKNAEEIAALREQLQGIFVRFNELDESITHLQNSMDDSFFGIKLELIQQAVDRINGTYEMYTSALKALLRFEKPEKVPGSYRARLNDLGMQIASVSGVYADLKKIHSGLVMGDQNLLIQAHRQTLRQDADVIAQSIRLKAFLANYLAVQVRGIILMMWASADPDVPFQDADDNIQRIWDNIDFQGDYYPTVVGEHLDAFARRVFANPNEPVVIQFWSARTRTRHGFKPSIGEYYGAGYSDQHHLWTAELAQKISADSFDANIEYSFIFRSYKLRSESMRLCCKNDHSSCIYSESDATWKIIPVGGLPVKLQCKTSTSKGNNAWAGLEASHIYRYDAYEPNSGPANRTFHFVIGRAEDMGVTRCLFKDDEPIPAGVPVMSTNLRWRFEISSETGFLQLIDTKSGKIEWQVTQGSGETMPDPQGYLEFGSDSNLVVRRKDGRIWWKSESVIPEKGMLGSCFLLTDEGYPFVAATMSNFYPKTLWAPRGGEFKMQK
ncbi:hypothetical protein TARUN_7571 [Trichoderma arundinaceum]|uniref:Bulb-type lectin domain-containing protein n=1 Tax=Trichoderma arundinaceum TaxID=490622 RepID=A0A395NFC1_TRIAR|nr:hypothetical protein TARUN_7571 [Trichoderma arundinaceum]